MLNKENRWSYALNWTDRFIPTEIREDPILHLRTQLALFFSVPGGIVALLLTAHASTLSTDGISTLVPFCIAHILTIGCSFALMNRKTINLGLMSLGIIVTIEVIYASYLSGGFSNVTMAWFVVIPVLLSLLAGTAVAATGAVLCFAALLTFFVLENNGHEFPVIVEQTGVLWVTVVGYGIATVCVISTYSQSQMKRAVHAYRSEIERRTLIEQTLRHAQQRLRIAKSAAEAGSDAKGAFLAQVSHEIRNPLTAIMGTIDLLELPAEPKVTKARIQLLRRSAISLLELVDDVLDFSKIEAGQMELECHPLELGEIVEDVVEVLIDKGVFMFNELPAGAQKKLNTRRGRRKEMDLMESLFGEMALPEDEDPSGGQGSGGGQSSGGGDSIL